MAHSGSKLGRKREDAIAALLSQGTIEKAASDAGIGARTLYRWLRIPEFHDAYRRARQDAFSQAIARLQQGSSAAATVLLKVMLDPGTPAAVRLRAADSVLNHAMRGNDIEAAEAQALAHESAEKLSMELPIELLAILRRIAKTENHQVPGVPLEAGFIEPHQESDPVRAFLEDRCQIATRGDANAWMEEKYWVPVAELYPSYAAWLPAAHRQSCPKMSFEGRLYALGREKRRVRPDGTRKSKQVWVWLGIRLQAAG